MEQSIYIIRFILKSEYYKDPVEAWIKWSNAKQCKAEEKQELVHYSKLNQLTDIEYMMDVEVKASPNSRIFFQFFEKTPNQQIDFPYDSMVLSGLSTNVPIEICEMEACRSPEKSRTTIRFKMNYFTYFGQNLHVVGSTRALGFWDKSRSLLLQHSGSVGNSSCGPNQLFSDRSYNWQGDMTVDCLPPSISYKYFCSDDKTITEEPDIRTCCFGGAGGVIEVNDIWRWKVLSVPLYSSNFFNTIFRPEKTIEGRIKAPKDNMVRTYFRASAIALGRDRSIRIVGSIPELGNWNEAKGIDLIKRERRINGGSQTECIGWSLKVKIPADRFPFEYKFIAPSKTGAPSLWENNENRVATRSNLASVTESYDSYILNFPDLSFHGASVFLDFASVRSSNNPICTFDIIKTAGEWASRCGFSHIQIANIFDQRAMTSKKLNLPVSGFALNPTLLSLGSSGFNVGSDDLTILSADKLNFIEKKFFSSEVSAKDREESEKFMTDNAYWLVDYTKLCYASRATGDPTRAETLDDSIKESPDYKNFSLLVAYIQNLCYKQIKECIASCDKLHIAVGIDIPFALHECSAEAKYRRYMFNQSCRLGIPPSVSKPIGEVFDSYPFNIDNAKEWLSWRIGFFGRIFPAIRLQSTIMYFRQWIIPRDTCVRAVFGHYEPSMSISSAELETWGLWDFDRYSRPYIHSEDLYNLFGYDAQDIQNIFMYQLPDSGLAFKQEFNTEIALKNARLSGRAEELRNNYLSKLMCLQGEVLLVKTREHGSESEFTPRSALNISPDPEGKPSLSFSALPQYEQTALLRLHDEFILNKQKPLWASKGRQALQFIKGATQSLVFSDAGGDLGEVCDDVIQKLTIVPLRVQIEGKGANLFDDVRSYQFFSVASPAKDSNPPLAYLWDNKKIETRKLWEEELWESGQAPVNFNGTVASTIMRQHCWSASLLAMFPFDTLIGSNNHVVSSDHSPYGALDLPGFLSDKSAENEITAILEQTKRKN